MPGGDWEFVMQSEQEMAGLELETCGSHEGVGAQTSLNSGPQKASQQRGLCLSVPRLRDGLTPSSLVLSVKQAQQML